MKPEEPNLPTYNQLAYLYPPDLQKCITHRLANRIFRKIDFNKPTQQVCECCGRYVGQQSDADAFCYDPLNQFSYLGPGVSLLFVFVQNIIITLFLLAVIYAIQGVITNSSFSNCLQGQCNYQTLFSKLSVSQKVVDVDTLKIQLILILVFTLLWIFVNQFLVYRCRIDEMIADQKLHSPSDFAIFLMNLPEDTTKKDIEAMLDHTRQIIETKLRFQNVTEERKQFLNQMRDFKVVDIIIPLKLEQFMKQEKAEEDKFKSSIRNGTFQKFERQMVEKPTETAKFAIVVFQKQITKDLFLKNYDLFEETKFLFCNWGLNQSRFKVKGKHISVVRASQPDDIIWENLQYSHKTIIFNKFRTFAGGLLVVFMGALIEFALSVWQINNKKTVIHSFIVGLSSVLVTFVNYIISLFLIWATDKEGNITKSKYNASLNVKICIFQFINSGLFYTISNLLASLISNVNFEQSLQVAFAEKITVFMIINAFSEPIENIVLDYFQIPHSIQRFFAKYDLVKLSQKDSNSMYEMNDSKIPFKYAYIVKTIWLTCFYTPFVPMVSFISLAGLVFYYIVMKLSFRYCYKITEVRSNQTNLRGLRLSYFVPFMLNLGQFVTIVIFVNKFYELDPQLDTLMYVSLIFSAVYGLFPWYEMNQRIFSMKNESNMNYNSVKNHFEVTYNNKMFSKIHSQSYQKNQHHFFFKQIKKYSCKDHQQHSPANKVVIANKIKSLEVLPSTRPFIS